MDANAVSHWRTWAWITWLVAAMLLLAFLDLTVHAVVVSSTALVLAAVSGPAGWRRQKFDKLDLTVVAVLYVAVVVLFRVAFTVFTATNVLGLFLCFGTGLTLGVAGPVFYTVRRGRHLSDLGLWLGNWKQAVGLGLVLAAIQFAVTLLGYPLPTPVDWVPLLVMSLTVGAFETIFFRGFVQTRLSASLGQVPGVGAAATLYAVYHVGYGMGGEGMVFLFGLGVIYAVAYALTRNFLVLWPLLTPLGSFFNNLNGGEIELPWESILGFADVLGLMAASVWLGHRMLRRSARRRAVAGQRAQRP
ncbi:CPBP family intramembrane glutamic endopeptidase [Arthrobacter sp. B3I4]|uniref:CPBP family intramembrane glutamic endopeptidase n=1 Tax=Arthrobacter sp. B3I4 TaxID=3042267 RepID=UPI00278195F6|nr:CPBP family intramembrane glutamic endopeptidase [Arthrobacter sp. B3I4]MDQ0755985.1 membrane protease YdiL (CAAX protease family) [Arthrobacter sp. B3I4]